jgi:hypothetical protein
MTSTIKVNNLQNQCGGAVVTKCGATTTISGSVVKADDIQAADGGNLINQCGTTITLGASGDTINLASGASQTGFGRTGTVDWQTGDIKTTTFTATNGEGYFANTSSGAFTMNLPAGTAGNIVSVVDYTNTFQTNNLTVAPNGAQKIGGIAATNTLSTEGQSVTFVYVDDTEGWKNVQDSTSNVTGSPFLQATGGTITTCGNCKIHTFTSPGTFCVSSISQTAPENQVSYLVAAGGGGGGPQVGASGGGGAGGFREFRGPNQSYSVSPLNGSTPITVTATTYPITVGAGGTSTPCGANGSNSVFSSITSTGGGGAGTYNQTGKSGGSGAGSGGHTGGGPYPGGAGNTPPVSPPQGQPGGAGGQFPSYDAGGGGGGAGGAGGNAAPPNGVSGTPGAGVSTSISSSPVTYSNGGVGAGTLTVPSSPAFNPAFANNRTANQAGGGYPTFNGGSGIVIIRYKFQ